MLDSPKTSSAKSGAESAPEKSAASRRAAAFGLNLGALRKWASSPRQKRRWKAMNAAAGAMYNAIGIASNIVVKLPLTVVILAILLLLIRGLSQHTTAIEPISVPRALADGGYTPEVAAQRLRDALAKFAEEAQIELAKSEIVTR